MTLQFLRKYGLNAAGALVANDLGIDNISVCNNGRLSRQGAEINPEAVLFNYGIAGSRWNAMLNNNPVLKTMSIINPWQQINKFEWLAIAKNAGINIPESVQKLDAYNDEWIGKPYYSMGGRNIDLASKIGPSDRHYYQRVIRNKKYELRVVFFKWVDQSEWLIWKRIMKINKEQITWNHHQGGTFVWVNKPDNFGLFQRIKHDVNCLINVCHLSFGAVDFIVDTDGHAYFIEVNTNPGFTSDRNRLRYVNLFRKLLEKSTEGQKDYVTI